MSTTIYKDKKSEGKSSGSSHSNKQLSEYRQIFSISAFLFIHLFVLFTLPVMEKLKKQMWGQVNY